LRVLEFIEKTGASFRVCDPLVEKVEGKNIEILRDWRQAVQGVNAIVIASDHKEFYQIGIEEASSLTGRETAILDGKNVISNLNVKPKYRVLYAGVGRPAYLLEPDGSKKRVEL
ncbi:MAG: UDP binding domain-containing protein, partial [Thermoproteota archaeon]